MLTQAQVNHYKENGFMVLKGFYAGAEIEMLREEMDSMITHAPVRRGALEDAFGQPVNCPNDFAFTDLDANGKQQVLNRISAPQETGSRRTAVR